MSTGRNISRTHTDCISVHADITDREQLVLAATEAQGERTVFEIEDRRPVVRAASPHYRSRRILQKEITLNPNQ